MKVWLKLLIGATLGIVLGIVLPDTKGTTDALEFLAELAVRIGKYALFPLMLFSVPVAVHELRADKRFARVILLSLGIAAAGLVAFSALGAVGVSMLKLPNIGGTVSTTEAVPRVDLAAQALSLFPSNPLSAFASEAAFVLPLYVLALSLGFAFGYDRSATKQVVAFFDSMSRVVYHVNSFLVEFLAVFAIALSAFATVRMRGILANETYGIVMLIVSVEALVVVFLALPAFIYFAAGRKNPFPVLYGLLGPALAGLLSGDVLFATGTLIKHSKDNLGVKRRINAISTTIFLTVGRAGTMLIALTAFVIVQVSYSKIGFDAQSFFWILFVTAPLVAIGLGPMPGNGAIVAVAALCDAYGKGFQESAWIALPIAFPLAAIGAFLDVLWAGAAVYAMGKSEGLAEMKPVRHFV